MSNDNEHENHFESEQKDGTNERIRRRNNTIFNAAITSLNKAKYKLTPSEYEELRDYIRKGLLGIFERKLELYTTRFDNNSAGINENGGSTSEIERYYIDQINTIHEDANIKIGKLQEESFTLSQHNNKLIATNKELKENINIKENQFIQFINKIKELEVNNSELKSQIQQGRIDDKIPGYVENVKTDLDSDDVHFIKMAKTWAQLGALFGILAVISSFVSLYITIDFKEMKGFELFYFFTRGLIGISILSWLSYICLSNSKKYTHESIRRKDRRHALMFGQVFLQIYGSTASKEDAILVFKDWNMSGGSAFSDQTEQPLGLSSLFQSLKEKLKDNQPDNPTT